MFLEPLSPVATDQFINYVVADECIYAARSGEQFDSQRIKDRLASNYGITTTRKGSPIRSDYLPYILQRLRQGTRPPLLPSILKGKATSRYYKDMMYAELGRLADCYLGKRRRYCGLPATRLHYLPYWLTASWDSFALGCETDQVTYEWMRDFHTIVLEREDNPVWEYPQEVSITGDIQVAALHTDIFQYFQYLVDNRYKNLYNIIDLDLMISIKSLTNFNFIAEALRQIAEPISIVNITTSVGRSISDAEYEGIMPADFIQALRSAGFYGVKVFSGRYLDRKMPMRYEHLLLIK
jgi:hypothetical protein